MPRQPRQIDVTQANQKQNTIDIARLTQDTSGAVIGPDLAVSGRVVTFDGTSGKLVQDSSVTLSTIGIGGIRNYGDSRVDGLITAVGGVTLDGNAPIKDGANTLGTTGQVLVKNASGGVTWEDKVRSDVSEGGTGSVVIGNMVKITQAAYTALGSKDADTLYFIVG